MARKKECMDGNTAAAHVAHATNEVIAKIGRASCRERVSVAV